TEASLPDSATAVTAEDDTAATITTEEKPGAVLVGYGVTGDVVSRRARRAAQSRAVPPQASGTVLAKPPIRKLAKDLEVDLSTVTATGPVGDVTREDVLRQASQVSVFRNLQTPEW